MGMDSVEQRETDFQDASISIAPDSLDQQQQQNPRTKPSDDARSSSRKLTPLQVNETMLNEGGDTSRSPKSPTVMRIASDSQYPPRSPRSNLAPSPKQQGSPRGEMGNTYVNGAAGGIEGSLLREATASPPKVHSYSQLRNVSSPFPQAMQPGNSSPPSPRSTTSPHRTGVTSRPETRPMPRTSSIDSAISSISLGTIHSQKPSLDSALGLPDISNLIQTAGSPEAVIQHLLKEKQHSTAQNAQLWKLVDKQRSLVIGLNQDLEKALRDKEKYRKKLKEHLEKVPPLPTTIPKAPTTQAITSRHSPTPSDRSAELPIQGQSQERAMPAMQKNPGLPVQSKSPRDNDTSGSSGTTNEGEKDEGDWVRSKNRPQDSKHSHKATSSSDVGVFGPLKPLPVAPSQNNRVDPPRQEDKPESPSQSSPSARPVGSPTTSFTAKRSQPYASKGFNGPALTLIDSIPPGNDLDRMTPPRKAPPAPLDLGQPKREDSMPAQYQPEDHSESDYDEDMEVDELPALERGRKKTREEDDRERETALLKEKQDRSRSKKEKSSKSRTNSAKSKSQEAEKVGQSESMPFTPSFKAFSPDPPPVGASAFLSPPASLASVLSPPEASNDFNITERILSTKPMSPGLPLSPRPNHRPLNPPTPRLPRDNTGPSFVSPPTSPRNAFVGLPLSPRAPRQPIPLPPHTPVSLASARQSNVDHRIDANDLAEESHSPLKSPTTFGQDPAEGLSLRPKFESAQSKGVFRGFVSEAYPDLLLPPNALPSIHVKVISSRLKPSRHSLVIKGTDEEPVFVLGISARSDLQDLWQVEKPAHSLQQLDQQLRQSSTLMVKHPDRSLFSGHAPAKVDARRIALEKYFETLLDTPMDERTAMTLCRYLSTQVSEPSGEEPIDTAAAPSSTSPVSQALDGKLLKEGYLTKRGKNFGGWKARFFVLNDPVLRYYETPGGSLLGTIKLQNAQIGKQNNKISHSPSRGEEADGSYRHAFLIREPKRKDSNSFMDHVLCAESDAERDAWVAALLCYVESPGANANSKPQLSKSGSGPLKTMAPSKKNSLKKEALSAESPDSENFENLQAVPYENTQAAQAPLVQITPDVRANDSPSPTTSGSQPSVRAPSSKSKAISGPQNGAKISDVGAWGNKPMAPPLAVPKEQKKWSMWGFRDKNAADIGANHSNDSDLSLTQQQYQEQITNVKAAFGATLAEAVEHCGPRGIDVCLPAVVYRCLEYLEMKDAASEEGIFRMSGSNTLIKGLRNRFNAEGDYDFLGDDEPYYDVHAVASLLKLYLRELPQPVLTRDLHLQFISVLGE